MHFRVLQTKMKNRFDGFHLNGNVSQLYDTEMYNKSRECFFVFLGVSLVLSEYRDVGISRCPLLNTRLMRLG